MSQRPITSAQLRAARALLRLEQKELAEASGVSVPTIKRLEGAEGPIAANYSTVSGIISALESRGIEFIPQNGGGAGVRFKERDDAGKA